MSRFAGPSTQASSPGPASGRLAAESVAFQFAVGTGTRASGTTARARRRAVTVRHGRSDGLRHSDNPVPPAASHHDLDWSHWNIFVNSTCKLKVTRLDTAVTSPTLADTYCDREALTGIMISTIEIY